MFLLVSWTISWHINGCLQRLSIYKSTISSFNLYYHKLTLFAVICVVLFAGGKLLLCITLLQPWKLSVVIMEIICCCQSLLLAAHVHVSEGGDTQKECKERVSKWHSEKVIKKSQRESTELVECLKCVWHSNFPPLCLRKITSLSSHKAKWNGPDGENKNENYVITRVNSKPGTKLIEEKSHHPEMFLS